MDGTRLGPYQILAKIGAGGMGEVYVAEDTRLGRKVAIKVLPGEFAADPERLARFEREARAAAALNHPHIAAVFDVGAESAGGGEADIHFIVQEYLQGETLREPLEAGALPVNKALRLGAEIAEALAAAHAAGIIHRDLKPDNVFITKDGHAKVLDFGLAKLTEVAAASSSDASMSPTLLGTMAGQVMGTAGYMSPEQAAGARQIDHRADLFAFGSLLYEMVGGRRAFAGRSIADTLARIQHEEPLSLAEIDRSMPSELQRIVSKALAKDAADRYQHADDLIVDLRSLARAVDTGTAQQAVGAGAEPAVAKSGKAVSIGLASSMALVLAVVGGLVGRSLPPAGSSTPLPEARFSLDLAAGVSELPRGAGTDVSISPDGQTVVYVGVGESGTKRLYARSLSKVGSFLLPGTEQGMGPLFSRDGEWVLFVTGQGTLTRVLLSGGEPFSVCDGCMDAVAGDDGNVYFVQAGALWRMPAAGGERELVSDPLPEQGVPYFSRPFPLPGSNAVLFEVGNFEFGGIAVLSLPDKRVIHISDDGSDPFYSPTGHILFPRASTLFAVPFDAEKLELTGSPEPVLQGVRVENAGALQAALSDDGTLVFLPADGARRASLAWVSRNGDVESVSEQRKVYLTPRVAPGGDRAAVVVNDNGSTDIWIVDLATGDQRQLTTRGDATSPVWTREGNAIAFGAGSAGEFAIVLMDAETRVEEELLTGEHALLPMAWSRQGRQLIFIELSEAQDIFVLDVQERTSSALLSSSSSEQTAALSHDGRLLAYVSDRTGVRELYVREFPTGREIQLSAAGGNMPVWSADNSELFFQGVGDSRVVAAVIRTEPRLEVVGQTELFSTAPYWMGLSEVAYDAGPDGRFLMVRQRHPEDLPDRLQVILNFSERLKRLAAGPR